MSQIRNGIFGSVAIALTLGAVQLAFAHDLIGSRQATTAGSGTGVNRAAKADRGTVPASPGQTQTIVLRHDGVADTSVLVRVPVAKAASNEARNNSTPPTTKMTKPGSRKITVACEPPVSVLTEVAKLLQPGRCVT